MNGATTLYEITPALIQSWREKHAARLSPRSVFDYLQILKTMFAFAIRMDLFSGQDPVGRLPRIYKPKIQGYTIDQIRVYLSACSHRYYPIAATLLMTGMRPIEFINLTRDDVDLARGLITIQPTSSLKNTSGRIIPISSQLRPILEEQLRKHHTAFVFPGVRGERQKDLKHGHDYALKRAGLPKIRMYDLRHMFATLLLTEGHDPMAVAELMGHGGLAITMRVYHHLHPDRARKVIDSMPQIVPVPNPALTRGHID